MAVAHYIDAEMQGEGRSIQAKYLAALASKRIALTYQELKSSDKAIPSAEKSMQLFQKLANKKKQVGAFMLLAALYENQGKYNQALVQYINALELAKEQKSALDIAKARVAIGAVYMHLGNFNKAKIQLKLSKKSFTKLNYHDGLVHSLTHLGGLSFELGQLSKAITYLESAEQWVDKEKSFASLNNIYSLLAKSYEQKSEYKKALYYYRKQSVVSQQLVHQYDQIKRESFELQYRLAEQLKYIEQVEMLLKKENQLGQNLKILSTAAMVITALLLIILLILKRRGKHFKVTSRKLTEQFSRHAITGLPDMSHQLEDANEFVRSEFSQLLDKAKSGQLSMAVVKLDFLSELYESRGGAQAAKIQLLMGRFVNNHFTDINFYHLRDNLLLAIAPAINEESAAALGQTIAAAFERFSQQVKLASSVKIGICAYPFLPHSPQTLSELQTLEVAFLALKGASQLDKVNEKPQWLVLKALDCMHPAFIEGEVRSQCQKAIEKGLIKVSYAGEKTELKW